MVQELDSRDDCTVFIEGKCKLIEVEDSDERSTDPAIGP